MKQKFFVLAFFVLIILTAGILYAAEKSANDVGDWWGKVTINGNSGNNGAIVDAYINGNKVASATVGQYEADYYLIHVEGNIGNTVLFKVNEVGATFASWSAGDHSRLDLPVTIEESSSSSSSSGGSSGGGGGGGGGSYIPAQTPGTASSDLTGDSGNSGDGTDNVQNQSQIDLETNKLSATGYVTGLIDKPMGKVGLILLVLGIGVIGIKYKLYKPLKKWIKKS